MDENQEEIQLKVALYLRVSTDDQADKYGLNSQREAIESLVKSKGQLKDGRPKMILAGKAYEYIDDGVSGTIEIDRRPEFIRLKEDVLNGIERGVKPFDVVAVYKIDRFARKLSILLSVLGFFKKTGIEFISASESIDTSTPFGRAMLGIMGVIAELELETIHERTTLGREQAIREGVKMGANAPYGYIKDKDKHLIVFEKEAKTVRRIFELFTISKFSTQKVADALKDDEILTPDASAVKYGKRKGASRKLESPFFWRAERIREILADEVYIGNLYSNKSKNGKKVPKNEWILSDHHHKAIILPPIFELTKQRLADLTERKTLTKKKEQGHIYLLSGLLKCDHCRKTSTPIESDMMAWTGIRKQIDNNPVRYSFSYQCNRKNGKKYPTICPVVPIPAESMENYVIDFVKRLLGNPQAVYEYQRQLASTKLNTQQLNDRKENYEGLCEAIPARRQNLRDQHELGLIDKATFTNKWQELETKEKEYKAKLKEIDYQLSKLELSKGYEESLKLYSEKYGKALDQIVKDKKELYDLIHMLVYQIVVYSRPRTEKDVIAGRKKEDQMIPNQIDIYLNLPQNLLRELYSQKFVVKSDNLWARRESNPHSLYGQ